MVSLNLAAVLIVYNYIIEETRDEVIKCADKFHREGIMTYITEMQTINLSLRYEMKWKSFLSRDYSTFPVEIYKGRPYDVWIFVQNSYGATESIARVENSKQLTVKECCFTIDEPDRNEASVNLSAMVQFRQWFLNLFQIHGELQEKANRIKSVNNAQDSSNRKDIDLRKKAKNVYFPGCHPQKSLENATITVPLQEEGYMFEGNSFEEEVYASNRPYFLKILLLGKQKLKIRWKAILHDELKKADLIVKQQPSYYLQNSYAAISACKVFVVKAPKVLGYQSAITNIFEPMVWMTIILSFILAAVFLHFIRSFEQVTKKTFVAFLSIIWIMYSVLMRQDIAILRERKFERLIFLWSMLWFILTSAFSGLLLSSLTSPYMEEVPESIDQLIKLMKEDKIHCCVQKHSSSEYDINTNGKRSKQSQNPVLAVFHDSMKDDVKSKVRYINDGLKLVLQDKYAYLDDDDIVTRNVAMMGKKKFLIVKWPESTKFFVFSVKWSSQYRKELLNFFNDVQMFGFVRKYYRDMETEIESKQSTETEDETQGPQPLTIDDLSLIFYILIGGHSLAVVVLVGELIFKAISN